MRPYPAEWERHLELPGHSVTVRPVRPDDASLFNPFIAKVSMEDRRLRFFGSIKELGAPFIARLTQLDYDRAMAFIVIDEPSGEMLGVARLYADEQHQSAEYAILVRSDLKGMGLGWQLMQLLITYARAEGLQCIAGQVLRENSTMLEMCRELGFDVQPESRGVFAVTLYLDGSPA